MRALLSQLRLKALDFLRDRDKGIFQRRNFACCFSSTLTSLLKKLTISFRRLRRRLKMLNDRQQLLITRQIRMCHESFNGFSKVTRSKVLW